MIFLLLALPGLGAEPEAAVRWEDWELADPAQIRAGQVTVESSGKTSVAFLRAGGAPPTAVVGTELAHPKAATLPPETVPGASPGHAVWVWDTERRTGEADREWMDFLQRQGVSVAFLQAPRQFTPALARMLADLRSRGIQPHALFGAPGDILPEGRRGLLAHLEQLRSFPGHFQGLHFDIEPYLLPGFGGARRNGYLRQYMALVDELVSFGYSMQLPVGFALPSWFDQPPPFSGPEEALLDLDGVRKLPFETCRRPL